MATATNRLGLIKASPGENYDVAVVNANLDTVDLNVGAKVVTSTARPMSPYVGQVIFESDTGRSWQWTGTYWQCLSTVDLSSRFVADPASIYGTTWLYMAASHVAKSPTNHCWLVTLNIQFYTHAWNSVPSWAVRTLYSNLPPAAQSDMYLGDISSNYTQYGDTAAAVTSGGLLTQTNRWLSRSLAGGWNKVVGSYFTPDGWMP